MSDRVFPPASIDNPPSTALCGCDCGCRRPLTPGNAMAQEIASESDAPSGAVERIGDAPEGSPKIIWHVDPDTVDPQEMAEAPVVLLICADCFVGAHAGARS